MLRTAATMITNRIIKEKQHLSFSFFYDIRQYFLLDNIILDEYWIND